jgi:organic radical activating enzyme
MKARIKTFINNILFTPKPIPAGNYQSMLKLESGSTYRLHLRIDEKGTGLMIINASTILHLNATAVEYAYHLIKETPIETIAAEMMHRYRVSSDEAISDFHDFKERMESLVSTPDLDPETFLDMERFDGHDENLSAPLRLDCALTYQVVEGSNSVYAPNDRVKRTLDKEEWKQVLKNAWEAGIPHVIFTGGEPTLRPDIPELVHFTQELGQVNGLITDGSRLTEKDYLHQLLEAGLDHLMIVLNPFNDQSWEAIRDAIAEDIFLTVHVTLNNRNKPDFEKTLEKLAKMQVKSLSLSADSQELLKSLPHYAQKAVEAGFSLVTDLPVPYSSFNPIALELEMGEMRTDGAGSSFLYVEPDGDVLAGQGKEAVLGNFLTDPFNRIWAQAKISHNG